MFRATDGYRIIRQGLYNLLTAKLRGISRRADTAPVNFVLSTSFS